MHLWHRRCGAEVLFPGGLCKRRVRTYARTHLEKNALSSFALLSGAYLSMCVMASNVCAIRSCHCSVHIQACAGRCLPCVQWFKAVRVRLFSDNSALIGEQTMLMCLPANRAERRYKFRTNQKRIGIQLRTESGTFTWVDKIL